MTFMRIFVLCFLSLFLAGLSHAQEQIDRFDVKIVAEQNGDLLITETITVSVEGRQIRRGILRELPRYQLYQGKEIPVRYDVKSIDRDDRREAYQTQKIENSFVLQIGNAEKFLQHRQHTYEISYLIKDELRRSETADEVYWNVTGSYWRFPIEKVTATVIAPQDAVFQEMNIYTGPLGAKGKDASFRQAHPEYHFETTRPFREGEGLTISLAFDKGVFGGVQASTLRYIWRLRNLALIILSLSFLGIAYYYYRSWDRVGRDPVKGPVFAQYEPPRGYSPAAASYIYYRGVKGHKALIATLMGLAHKNWISIDADKRQTILTPLDRDLLDEDEAPSAFELTREAFAAIISGDKRRLKKAGLESFLDDDLDEPKPASEKFLPLNSDEAQLFARLFPSKRQVPITLNKSPNSDFHSAHAMFQSRLRREYGKPYFKVNLGYIMLGVFLSVAAVIITASQISNLTPRWIAGLFLALILMNGLFIYLMPAPTKKGQKIRTEIEGFRLFMKTAEKQKFDSVEVGSAAPPPMSVSRYEQLLPYAIALDVEEPWSRYFEKVMPFEAKNYEPSWGDSIGRHGGLDRITENMVSNISSGVRSAAPQSSSSSGGGGGGFSGGGGGGGGGGGW